MHRSLRLPHLAYFISAILSFLLVGLLLCDTPAMAANREEKNQDIIFLVDTSSSMREIFDDVKRAISEYVRQARNGDNVVLISFGEKVELRIRRSISSEEDIKWIERELAQLEPTQYYTYMTGALAKGLEELRLLERKHPDHVRTVVLLSDGKNNPPEGMTDPITFEQVLKDFSGIIRSEGSAFFYLSLGESFDPQVLSFMQRVEGTSFDLGKSISGLVSKTEPLGFAQIFVEPVSIDLGTISGPKHTATVSLAFFPARGNASGQVITTSIEARFKENPSWKTLMEVRPGAFNCSDKPWTKILSINVESMEEGTIIGSLKLAPQPGHVLFIDPAEIPVTLTIRQPHVQVMQRGLLEFGPIDPRRKFQQTQSITLVPNEAAVGEMIRPESDVALPEGMRMEMEVQGEGERRELVVTVSTDERFQPSRSMTIDGSIRLSGIKQVDAFSSNLVDIRIKVAPPPGKTGLIAGWLSRLRRLLWPTVIVLVALSTAAAGYWWFNMRPHSELEGKLVLVHFKSKSHDSSRVVKINLNSVGRMLRRDSVVIGSSKEAGITLPHKSVAPSHCQFFAKMEAGKKRIYVGPVGRNSVIVNLQKLNAPMALSDRDLVEIGAYTFRFENPHPYKQLVVKYLDGRLLKGTPSTWDIESDGFGLLPRDALPGSSEEIYVPFADLKAVYFVRDFDGQLGKKIVSPASQMRGTHLRLTFHDGEQIDGYTSESYTASSPRFYFFPADQTGNTISMVVERRNLKNIETLKPASM
ncbi:MAG: hypothetical protein Kow0099_06780 [Candidatus Abyssubacteria bacterium]